MVVLRSPRSAASVCVVIAAVSAVLAGYDAWKMMTIAIDQLHGPAEGTDFLNLYAGARLLLTDPERTYQLEVQQTLQRSLTGRDSFLVPFYLPPYAALSLSWLGLFAYSVAYLVWLGIGILCILLAAYWMAPRWTRWYPLVWFGLGMLFLPSLLGLAQGQSAALMLLSTTSYFTGMLRRPYAAARLTLGLLGLLLKPQFAPVFVCGLILGRRWKALTGASVVLCVLAVVGLTRLGPDGRAVYSITSSQKLVEIVGADPTFLLGPTLLHAGHWFIGVNTAAHVVSAFLAIGTLAIAVYVWRQGPVCDDALLLQLSVLPIVSVVLAPYALVYELTGWIASFWLLWRYTEGRRAARAGLLWLTATVWVAGDVGVALPLAGGADAAALLGVCLVAFIGWLYRVHRANSITPAGASRMRLPSARYASDPIQAEPSARPRSSTA